MSTKRSRKSSPRKWTVVGFYTDNNQPWVEWTTAKTPEAAAAVAARARYPNDVAVLEVFAGHRKGRLNNEEVLYEDGIEALAVEGS